MSKVTVYNMKEMVRRRTNNKRTPLNAELAIIEHEGTIIVIDNEAVHDVYTSLDKTHQVQLHDLNDGKLSLIPAGISDLPISYIKQHAKKTREVELTDFVRHFGSRIESNYSLLLKTLSKAGLNPNNYERKRNHA